MTAHRRQTDPEYESHEHERSKNTITQLGNYLRIVWPIAAAVWTYIMVNIIQPLHKIPEMEKRINAGIVADSAMYAAHAKFERALEILIRLDCDRITGRDRSISGLNCSTNSIQGRQ